jgi:Kef-type K+ transport system membrane component KefB
MNFTEISAIFFVAAAFAIIAKLIKQPLLVGYILGGVFLGMIGFITDTKMLESLSQIGVALLLFLLGLEMNIREMPSIGRISVIVGIGQILFTFILGFILSIALGIAGLPSMYIAIGLTFSSTIIIIKLLSEKNDLNSLYGRISIGFLLVQDFVAIALIIFLSSLQNGITMTYVSYLILTLKVVALFVVVWLMSKKILPFIFEKFIAGSSELIFVVSIAWALGFAAFMAGVMGFSIEIGGFLAGISLSSLPEHLQISSKTKPVRDFFLTIFFILLGTRLIIGINFFRILPLAIIFSLFVLLGKSVIMLSIMGLLGFKKRTSFLTALTSAQISEFSLIVVAMGFSLGHLNAEQVSLITLVGIITMLSSTYMILDSEKIYEKIKKYIGYFEKKITKELSFDKLELTNHVVLVGCDRTGRSILNFLKKKGKSYIVVDFNPDVFSVLDSEKTPIVYGDVNDPDIFHLASVDKSSLLISTIGSLNDNLNLLSKINHLTDKPVTIMKASSRSDAVELYQKGASYVIVPEFVAGEHIRHLLSHHDKNYSRFVKAGKIHFNKLLYA